MAALADPWVQMFGVLAVASGGFTFFGGGQRPGAAGAKSPDVLVGAASAAALGGQKTPGRWLVDARLASDADTADLGKALAAAREGETVYVRAGLYRGSFELARSIKLVGLGEKPDSVVVEAGPGGAVFSVPRGEVTIKNLSMRGGLGGVSVSGGGRVFLSDAWISNAGVGLLVDGTGSAATLERVRVLRCQTYGLVARAGASVQASRSEIIGQKQCGVYATGGKVSLTGSTVSMNDYGACSDATGAVDAGDSDLNGNLRGPTLRQ